MSLSRVVELQLEFQKLCDIDLTANEHELSEMYLFKAIEEVVELRKTLPSHLNKWAKTQGEDNREETLSELADVLLFLLNFSIVKKITPEETLIAIMKKQEENFLKLKEKKLKLLQAEMRGITSVVGFGGGNLNPKVILVGQNPGESLTKNPGASCWNDVPKNGAVAFFKRALKHGRHRLAVKEEDFYFLNVVPEPTKGNEPPSNDLKEFWWPYTKQELDLIRSGVEPVVLGMGRYAQTVLMQKEVPYTPIHHPAYFIRNGFSEKQYYEEQLLPRLKQFDLEE